jgi:hypothetical protein
MPTLQTPPSRILSATAGFVLLMSLFVFFCVPETKGVPIEELNEVIMQVGCQDSRVAYCQSVFQPWIAVVTRPAVARSWSHPRSWGRHGT